jgi:hypothetical protein
VVPCAAKEMAFSRMRSAQSRNTTSRARQLENQRPARGMNGTPPPTTELCLVLSRPLALPPGNHVVGNGRRAPGNAGIVGAELPADPQSPGARLLRR